MQGNASRKVSWVNQFPPSMSKSQHDTVTNGDSNVFVRTNPKDGTFTLPPERMPGIKGDETTSIQYLTHRPPSPEFDVDPALKAISSPQYVRCSICRGYAVIDKNSTDNELKL